MNEWSSTSLHRASQRRATRDRAGNDRTSTADAPTMRPDAECARRDFSGALELSPFNVGSFDARREDMCAVPIADVEHSIRVQHAEIRARLRALTRDAERADLPWALDALRLLLRRFAVELDEHLAFEELELAPRIRELDAWGKAREAALLSEHRDQRRRVESVCALTEEPAPDLDEL